MRRQLTLALVLVAGAGGLLGGVSLLGRMAREQLRQDERYSIPFEAIDCPPPPGYQRLTFLHEVQYIARLPDRLQILDRDLPSRLAEAFSRHAWVEKVEEVQALPPDQIRVRTRFRTPVLAVRAADGPRVVDARAFALPPSAPEQGLPQVEVGAGPRAITGRQWNHPSVAGAAAIAGLLHPHQDRLQVTNLALEEEGWVLRGNQVRVLWGAAPGKEPPTENPATKKIDRLLDHCAQHGRLDLPEPATHDVRIP